MLPTISWRKKKNTPWLECRSRGCDDNVGVVQWRHGDAGGASRRWQCHPRDQIRVRTVGGGSGS
jgi:hypothetical protein